MQSACTAYSNIEVFCNFEDYILQFQSVKILLRNSVKAKESAEDAVAGADKEVRLAYTFGLY